MNLASVVIFVNFFHFLLSFSCLCVTFVFAPFYLDSAPNGKCQMGVFFVSCTRLFPLSSLLSLKCETTVLVSLYRVETEIIWASVVVLGRQPGSVKHLYVPNLTHRTADVFHHHGNNGDENPSRSDVTRALEYLRECEA